MPSSALDTLLADVNSRSMAALKYLQSIVVAQICKMSNYTKSRDI